jgi:hypothetical protein
MYCNNLTVVINFFIKFSSSSHTITNLGHGGLFRSQLSYRLVVSSVVDQVVVFLLDVILEVVQKACSLSFDERVGTNRVSLYFFF